MTRLSDALRGAADRAPVETGSVSVEVAKRQVRRNRALRGTGNSLAGAGAVALLALGIFAPGMGAPTEDGGAPGALSLPEADSKLAAADEMYANGTCGAPLYFEAPADGGPGIVVDWAGGELEGGDDVALPATVTAPEGSEYTLGRPLAYVLWNGTVVGMTGAVTADALVLGSGESAEWSTGVQLVNCFDGKPLPAADYQLVVVQAMTASAPVEDGVDEPEPTPGEPEPLPSDGAGVDPEAAASVEPAVVDPAVSYLVDQVTYYSEPISFSVAGERVENPFADYLGTPWTPPAKPDGVLTPAVARELFEAAATDSRWDFAAGTSRWILPNWGEWDELAQTTRNQSWFGCSWDGQSGLTFPERSAELDLLEVEADVPSRIDVRYGFVVDGNPGVSLEITNTSDYTLTGFQGEASAQFYLVRNGRVVAEWYPQSINRAGDKAAFAERSAAGPDASSSSLIYPAPDEGDYWGALEPGDSTSGEFIWRDVNGCWSEAGPGDVPAGTYTVLSARTLYLESGTQPAYPVEEPLVYESGDGAEGLARQAAVDAASGDAGDYEWLEMQLWTSHGTITVTTS